VSDFRLTPASSLGSLARPALRHGSGEPGVIVAERTDLALCSVLARKGTDALLAERVRQTFGVELPSTPRYSGPGPVAFAWAGPGQWLAIGTNADSRGFETQLKSSLTGVASVTDQSDGRTVVRVGGPRARDALAKGIHIDLHPSVFGPGSAGVTAAAYIGVHFWQVDAAPTYEFAMFRSFAVSFCEWLISASAECGIDVAQDN
jgi:sarcosine oxidase subunit gamma